MKSAKAFGFAALPRHSRGSRGYATKLAAPARAAVTYISRLSTTLAERGREAGKHFRRRGVKKTNDRHRRLRVRREWPSRRAPEQRYEFAPFQGTELSLRCGIS